jgi:hypothetical protein
MSCRHSGGVTATSYGHLEKNRFTLEAPIETHVLAGAGLGQWFRQGRFFELPLCTMTGDDLSVKSLVPLSKQLKEYERRPSRTKPLASPEVV